MTPWGELIPTKRKTEADAARCECGAFFCGEYPWSFRKSAGIHVHPDPTTGHYTVKPKITFLKWSSPTS